MQSASKTKIPRREILNCPKTLFEVDNQLFSLPKFPDFKPVQWSDREIIQGFTSCFLPYSDFNFVSMWSWNTREKMMVSQLNGNLVLLFYDYLTETPFLSFIGRTELRDTARKLIEYSKCKLRCHALKLVPEEMASNLPESEFTVIPDPDAHDYILSVPYLNSLDALPRSEIAATLYKKFIRLYPHHTIQCNPIKQIVPGQFIDLYKRWAKDKELDHLELNEYSAFERYIHQMDTGNYLVSLHDGNRMIGFASFEILNEKYAICHFAKAEKVYKGV